MLQGEQEMDHHSPAKDGWDLTPVPEARPHVGGPITSPLLTREGSQSSPSSLSESAHQLWKKLHWTSGIKIHDQWSNETKFLPAASKPLCDGAPTALPSFPCAGQTSLSDAHGSVTADPYTELYYPEQMLVWAGHGSKLVSCLSASEQF